MQRASFLSGAGGAALAVALPAIARADAPPAVDLWPMVLALAGTTDAASIAQVRSAVLQPYAAALYETLLGMPVTRISDDRIRGYLGDLVPFAATIRAYDTAFTHEQRAIVGAFAQTFADFAYDRPIYVLPSFFAAASDDAPLDVHGAPTILIALDTLAKYAGANASIAVVAVRRLFGAYHRQVTALHQSSFDDWGLRKPLWFSGLPAYVAQQLSPGTSDAAALLDEPLAAIYRSQHSRLASLFLTQIDDAGDDPNGAFGAWFGATATDPLVPARAGVALGLDVAKRLALQQPSLPLLARSFGADPKDQIDTALHAIANS